MSHFQFHKNFTKEKAKFIKSLRLKKYQLEENSFILEGAKNVKLLVESTYEIRMLIGTSQFFHLHPQLLSKNSIEIFEVSTSILNTLGTFQENNAVIAVAKIPPATTPIINPSGYSLVLDNIQDPGNLGTILRIADWYNIPNVICSINTVYLYNSKVLQASMGSFINVKVYYTDLEKYLAQTNLPIIGTFTQGKNLHYSKIIGYSEGLIVIGNEAHGISPALLPYIQEKISIPSYGKAESLNAAVATGIVCDNLRRIQSINT